MSYTPKVCTLDIIYFNDLNQEVAVAIDLPEDLTDAGQLVTINFDAPNPTMREPNLCFRTPLNINPSPTFVRED